MENVVLLRDRWRRTCRHLTASRFPAYLGIDIGSVSTNVVAIDECGR